MGAACGRPSGVLCYQVSGSGQIAGHDGRQPCRLAAEVILWYYSGMKTAVSIPDELFETGEALSKRLRLSRSRLYATALAEFVAKHRGRKITERLNALYAEEDSRLPAAVRRAQGRSLARDSW